MTHDFFPLLTLLFRDAVEKGKNNSIFFEDNVAHVFAPQVHRSCFRYFFHQSISIFINETNSLYFLPFVGQETPQDSILRQFVKCVVLGFQIPNSKNQNIQLPSS